MTAEKPIAASVAGRYATALFELAREENKLDEAERDLGTIGRLLDESADLRRLVRSPAFSSEDQSRALTKVLETAGVGTLTCNFVRVITANRRLFAIDTMLKAFRALLAHHRGEVAADVTSAVPLKDAQIATLKETLRGSVGKNVQVSMRVDPSLLGGLIVRIGSRMIDSSLKTKLANMKVALKG